MENEVEIFEHGEPGYKTVCSFESWRVALMNESEKTTPEGLPYFQKHDLTDEIFVLLKGECTLIVAGNQTEPQQIKTIPMESGKVYNVKRGVWHTHVLTENSTVFIVENKDTGLDNSPVSSITPEQRQVIKESN